MKCRGIGDILQENKIAKVHFMVIDVQGAELTVLQTLDWSIPTHVIVVEMNQNKTAIRDLLLSHGYESTMPEWDIRKFCGPKECPNNEAFVNAEWKED